MLLIGMFDSPYVRRVAISLRLGELDFEHRNWSVGRDFERIRAYNPLGRVPVLVLDDGEALCESAAILDWIDETVGSERALLPARGPARRRALQLMATATSAADKGVAQLYERAFRPPDKYCEPWVQRCRIQTEAGLAALDVACAARPGSWLLGDAISQADITVTCASTFLIESLAIDPRRYPALDALRTQAEALPAFAAFHERFYAPEAGA